MAKPLSSVLTMGNILDVQLKASRLQVQTQNAFVEIVPYSTSVIRLRINKTALERDFSYAVVGDRQPCEVALTENKNSYTFSTDAVSTVIQKNPFSVAFYTPDGRLINEDERDLSTSWISEEVTTYKRLQEGERFIGLGEKTGDLDRKGSGYTHWNKDSFGYGLEQDPIYSTIPFYIGVHHQLNYGIFFDNTFQSDFNFGASNNRFSSFGARGGEMNYYFIYGETIADIIEEYTALTGRMELPPLWSLGYQQNRYSYYPDTEVMRIAQTLREKKIPADGITLDIYHMEDYKLFTWDKKRFPYPAEMNKKLNKMGFKTTVIVDPGLKKEEGYEAYEEGEEQNVYLKYIDGKPWTAAVWPGWCNFPDFTNARVREWWKKKMEFYKDSGVSGIWSDMNEPATWGHKAPSNVIFDFDGQPTTTLEAHNVYGLEMTRSCYEGAQKIFSQRPFVLTRAAYAGVQRYAALWTGDNISSEEHMLLGIRLLNSLGLSGVAFSGMDVGGFTENATGKLFARWIQLGAFFPYFRSHTNINTNAAEPWTFGEEVTEIARNFIGLRYRLLPYLYAHFYAATQNGMPVMRSLAIDYTHDEMIYDPRFQNEFLFGSSILVLPYRGDASFGESYFPEGMWYHFFNDKIQDGKEEKILKLNYSHLPVYVRESSIIPMQSLIQSTAEKPEDVLYLHIYRGKLNNRFEYYEDDGESYQYQSKKYYKRGMVYDATEQKIKLEEVEGDFLSKFNQIKLIFHGLEEGQVAINKEDVQLKEEFLSLIKPISHFDPHAEANPLIGASVLTCTIKNSREEIVIEYKG